MHIRTFTGDTAQTAMAKVRAEMGPDAVIIAVEETAKGGGVIVRAAVETNVAANDVEELDASDGAYALPSEERLTQLLKARLRAPAQQSQPRLSRTSIADALAYHRLPDRFAAMALRSVGENSEATSAEESLAHALDHLIAFAPLPIVSARPILLIGAPGAGKTSVAARLAQRAATAGAAPLLITLDGDKAGARAQIETYAAHLNFQAYVAADAVAAKKQASQHASGPVLIDTAGTNVFDAASLGDLRRMVAHLDADPVAVISAGMDAEDVAEMAELFLGLGVARFICTRTDTSRRLGGLVAAAAAGLGLSHTTASALISEGVETPDSTGLARRLLRGASPASLARAA